MMVEQQDMFTSDWLGQVHIKPEFDGKTYEPEKDRARLSGQLQRVFDLVVDGKKRTLGQIRDAVGGSEAGISARLRDLRKPKFGGFQINRERLEGGLWVYWMGANEKED